VHVFWSEPLTPLSKTTQSKGWFRYKVKIYWLDKVLSQVGRFYTTHRLLRLVLVKITSHDLRQFRLRLFRSAHAWMLTSSAWREASLLAGMIRYVSSANSHNEFPAVAAVKFPALMQVRWLTPGWCWPWCKERWLLVPEYCAVSMVTKSGKAAVPEGIPI